MEFFPSAYPAEAPKGNYLFFSSPKKINNLGSGFPLGIITKLQVSCTGGDFQKNSYDSAQAEVELFALQDLACKALPEKQTRATKDGGSYDTYVHRVNYCIKQRVDASRSVFVRYNENRKKAHYDNLQRCGSVWTCPFVLDK